MPFSTYGDPIYGLADCKVGKHVDTAGVISYTNITDVMSVQLMSASIAVSAAELPGDDRITAVAARPISGSVNVRFAGMLTEVLAVITGRTATVTGVTPNRIEQLLLPGGAKMPYFGICGQGLAEEGLGDMLIFVPKCKITSEITLSSMEYGGWQVAEFTVQAVDDIDYGVINIIRRETTGAFTLPPAGITTL